MKLLKNELFGQVWDQLWGQVYDEVLGQVLDEIKETGERS